MNEKEVNEMVNEETVETVEVDEVAELTAQVEELKKELAKAKNDYYKAYADAENRKKVLERIGSAVK